MIALAAFLFTRVIRADDQTSDPDFSHYPQTPEFKEMIPGIRPNYLLAVSAIFGENVTLMYVVRIDGNEVDWRDVTGDFGAEQASHFKKLSLDDFKALQNAINELPATNVYPPMDRLVIVRYLIGQNWTMHTYDRDNLPKAMHDIYAIIGERFESKSK